MSKLLWKPSQERIDSSRMSDFINHCHSKGFNTPDYEALYTWSVSDKASFWNEIWEYFSVIGTKGIPVIENEQAMPGATWFGESTLNFAENLLKRNDDAIAIVERGEDSRRETWSYQELRAEVSSLSQYLRKLGLKKGDRVAGFLPNSHYSIVAMLATASIGAVWSSCSPDFGFNGVLDRFAQIQPKVLFATNGYTYATKKLDTQDRVKAIYEAIPSIEQVIVTPYLEDIEDQLSTLDKVIDWPSLKLNEGKSEELIFEPMSFDDPLYILYSSGTTGKPKCIVHSIGGTLLQHLKELALHTDVKESSTLFYYTTCGWMMWNWLVSGLALGATIVLFDGSPFHPKQSVLFDLIDEENIDIFGASAKYYSACEKFGLLPKESHQLDSLKAILSTGSPLTHESFDYLYQSVKSDVCVSSISGGTDIISCFALGNPVLPVYQGELQCLGLGMDVHFYDDDGQDLKSGKGELVCLQSFPSMPTGFWNDTANEKYQAAYFSRFKNIWAHGDYGELISHSKPTQTGVVIHGRSDAVLNPGGVRIGTSEIYRQVEKVDAVFECIAIGQEWQDDVRVILFVRLKEGVELSDDLIDTIKKTIRQNTTPRHVPAKVIQIADIPKTLSGKMVELAVRNVVHGKPVTNTEALANPEALKLYENLPALDC